MATAKQIQNFISEIAPVIQKYAKAYGYRLASPIIAQACIESAYGTSSLGKIYHNYFGMKAGSAWRGKSVNLATKEEYTAGTLTSIKAAFRVYDSLDEGVKGYFDFISAKRYANLKQATTAQEYLEFISADGYATSKSYVKTCMSVVIKYGLTVWDTFTDAMVPQDKPVTIKYAQVVGCWFLSCRDKANGTLIGVFARDTVLTLHDSRTAWWKVTGNTPEGKTVTGYCYNKYLKEV